MLSLVFLLPIKRFNAVVLPVPLLDNTAAIGFIGRSYLALVEVFWVSLLKLKLNFTLNA